jgi:metal-responsive CopG/Arc/MetJ family transcriptional regulator
MNRHGLSRKDICTVSAKVDVDLRDKLDEIKTKLNLKNRSEVLRLAIEAYISE